MSEHLFERPASSLSQSLSTTTEEKEVPYLTVSVTIKPGIEQGAAQKPEVQSEKLLDENVGENEEFARAGENAAIDSQSVVNTMGSNGKVEREEEMAHSEGMKTEQLLVG